MAPVPVSHARPDRPLSAAQAGTRRRATGGVFRAWVAFFDDPILWCGEAEPGHGCDADDEGARHRRGAPGRRNRSRHARRVADD
jgi:hypothetical protein